MPMMENNRSTSNLDGTVRASIRQAITNFHHRCGLQYENVIPDKVLYAECCKEAINREFPMDGKHSIRPYMSCGAAMSSLSYAHLPDRPTMVWIGVIIAVLLCIDDNLGGAQEIEHVYLFNERFSSCQPQGDPVLKALDSLLRETRRHYSPLVSNLIITSILDYISSLLIDHETKDMQISTQTPLYPNYCRLMSGAPTAAVLWIFPSTLPLPEYIQSMPDLINVMNYANDILSFYKEEVAGDTTTYLSRVAASRAITRSDALHEVIDQTVQSHHNILESLKMHTEAYDAYVSFFRGYVGLHSDPRYKLGELMSDNDS